MQDADDNEGWGSDFDDDNQDAEQDDDDTSWKVRRGAYRVMDAIISTRPDMHTPILEKYGTKLAGLFRERVDDVKCDLLEAFRTLVQVDEQNCLLEHEKKNMIKSISQIVITNLCKQAKSKNLKVKVATLSCLAALGNSLQ